MSSLNKFKITTTIREMLIADPNVKEMVDDKIFPLIAVKDTIGDFITYQRDAYTKNRDKMGVNAQDCYIWINAISDKYDRSQELACRIDDCLDGTYTFNGSTLQIWLDDSTEVFEDGKYIQVLLYAIK